VVYDVPLTGSKAPNAMGTSDVAAWGQADVPTDATAVFPADSIPASNSGSALAASAYTRATITYTDASGREVNTATPGGRITTTEYDRFGNTIRELDAGNRELALTSATSGDAYDELSLLHIVGAETADRAEMLSTRSVYSSDGLRMLDEKGPLHLATLTSTLAAGSGGTDVPAGTPWPVRQHTVNTYDEGRPTDGTATVANQVTTTKVGAYVDGYPSDGHRVRLGQGPAHRHHLRPVRAGTEDKDLVRLPGPGHQDPAAEVVRHGRRRHGDHLLRGHRQRRLQRQAGMGRPGLLHRPGRRHHRRRLQPQ
jgi:YD repeat-containing protein